MINHGWFEIVPIILLCLKDILDEKVKYKIPNICLPIKIPPCVVLFLYENSGSSSLQVEITDIREFLAHIEIMMNHDGI